MKFTEKLEKLTESENRSRICRRAGLPASAISNYITNGQMPGLEPALKIAAALDVPLDWLADDSRGFPVPAKVHQIARLAAGLREADQMELLGLAMTLTARQLRQGESQSNTKRK